jgi:hypothetical protein
MGKSAGVFTVFLELLVTRDSNFLALFWGWNPYKPLSLETGGLK